MALGHEHHHETHATAVAEERAVVRQPFGVAQVVSLLIGIFFVVLGAVGLARAGFDDLTREAAAVGPFRMTGLLAFLHLAIGLLAMVGATGRAMARSTMMVLGPTLITAGIIAAIQDVRALGWNDATAIAYIVTGIVALLSAILTPVAAAYRRTVI